MKTMKEMNVTTPTDPTRRGSKGRWLRCLLMACFAGLLSLSAPGPQADAQSDAAEAQQADEPEAPMVDLNTATEAELVTLPGIGPAKAQAIIARREQRPFRRIEEVMRVRGIGRATFRRLRDRLTVSTQR